MGIAMAYLIPEEFKLLRDSNWVYNNVEKIVLENTEDNHYKYYHISRKKPADIGYVVTEKFTAAWGRIGAKPQVKEYNQHGLKAYGQMIKKLEKGYRIKTYKSFGDHCSSYDEFMSLIGDDGELFD